MKTQATVAGLGAAAALAVIALSYKAPEGTQLFQSEMMTAEELIARGGTPQPRGSGIFGKGTPAPAPMQPITLPNGQTVPQPMPSMPSLPSVTLPKLPTLGSRPSLTRSPMRGNPRER